MPSAAELLQWRKSCVSGISQGNFMLAFLGTFRCVSCKLLKLKQLTQATFFSFSISFPWERPLYHLIEVLWGNCLPLRSLRYLRENIHIRVLNLSPKKPQCLPQISQITQTNPKTTQIPNSLSLRNNTACCIPLRDLRYLRENMPFAHVKNDAMNK